jgi:hypothetical protein
LTLQIKKCIVKEKIFIHLKFNIMDIPIQELFDGEEEDTGFDHPSMEEN